VHLSLVNEAKTVAEASSRGANNTYSLSASKQQAGVQAAVGLPSDQWRPWVFTSCEPGMPREFAPCLAQTLKAANVEVRAA
jgi:hypothetical protein